MDENSNKRRLIGIDRNSFAPFAALLVAALGSVLYLVFAVMNVTAMTPQEPGLYAAGDDVIFVIAGGVGIAACVYFAAAVLLARKDPRFNVLLLFAGAPFAAAFLLSMIGGIMRSGQYTQVVEILYFIFMSVAALALAAVFTRFLTRRKSIIALCGISAIGVVCAFIPVITGNVEIFVALRNYIPSCVMLAATAALAVGADNTETVDEKV